MLDHTTDTDCAGHIEDNECQVCGAYHAEPCSFCGATAYHDEAAGCPRIYDFGSHEYEDAARKWGAREAAERETTEP